MDKSKKNTLSTFFTPPEGELTPPTDEEMSAIPDDCLAIAFYTAPGHRPRYVSGEPHGDRIRVRYFHRQSDDLLLARAWFGPGCEGPPWHAHGGSSAALLDEAMGIRAWMTGKRVLAGRIQINFRAPLPLGRTFMLEAWVERVSGRKVVCKAKLLGPDGTVYVDGEGLYLELDPNLLPEDAEFHPIRSIPDGAQDHLD